MKRKKMDIDTPLRELGEVEIDAIRTAILALDGTAWKQQQLTQNTHEVHQQTESIMLVHTTAAGWPEIEVSKENGWDLLADVAVPLMHGIIETCYPKGGSIIRAMVSRLPAGRNISPHIDQHPSFHAGHRVHVPITANPRVRFMIDGQRYNLEPGKAYELNNQKNHSVMNKGRDDTISFLFDYVPPAKPAT
jgi:hypothetical protein